LYQFARVIDREYAVKMEQIELKKQELLYVTGEHGERFFGGNQYWYPKGDFTPGGACGSTTASNILAYILKARPELLKKTSIEGFDSKAGYLGFMKTVYRYYHPSIIGLPTSWFIKGTAKFAKEHSLAISAEMLKVRVRRSKRPSFSEAAGFIRTALENDTPVAYLILSAGGVENLYKWHWVTIIGLDEKNKKVRILDNTGTSWADLGAWLDKSFLGGAFVRILI